MSSSDDPKPKKCKIQPKLSKFFTPSPVVTQAKLSHSPVETHMENESQSDILIDTDSFDKELDNEHEATSDNESEELPILLE